MKKADLLHTTILILAILLGYSVLQSAIYFLAYLTYSGDRTGTTATVLYQLLPILFFSAACILLIRNGRKYTATLLRIGEKAEETEADTSEADTSETEADTSETHAPETHASETRRNIIFALFIGIGLYTLIQAAPYVITELVELFTNKIGSGMLRQPSSQKTNLIIQLLKVTLGAFLIYAAPSFTNFIEKSIVVRLDSASQSR
jgi:hypothetical protein